MIRKIIIGISAILSIPLCAQNETNICIDAGMRHQTIHSFGASDCWRAQFLGNNWPEEKKEQMADWLFSTEKDKKGNPKGIGLSLWRFNIGSGSHEAGNKSGVNSAWRRTECFLDENRNWDFSKQRGQRWFLDAARKRGVKYTLGFSISAPYFMSINGMARADKKNKYANLKETEYANYADFMVKVCKELQLDYLSPINEPQWEWTGANQEGMQATNRECSRLIHYIDEAIQKQNVPTKVVFGEAGDIRYIYRSGTNKPDRDNQINEIYDKDGMHSISGLSSVAPIVTGHSYWSTWPVDTLLKTRSQLCDSISKKLPDQFSYWQTEYCPMEKNADNPNGGGNRDLGINTALYIARIIHADLVKANATSWQSWTAFTEWDYKDGLIFVDDGVLINGARTGQESMIESCKYDGTCRDSKYLWALGNYSHFIRPGMIRVHTDSTISEEEQYKNVMTSAYIDEEKNKLTVVLINFSDKCAPIHLSLKNIPNGMKKKVKYKAYETSEKNNLTYIGKVSSSFSLSPRSIVTLVSE